MHIKIFSRFLMAGTRVIRWANFSFYSIIYFSQLFENYRSGPIVLDTFCTVKLGSKFDPKWARFFATKSFGHPRSKFRNLSADKNNVTCFARKL
jgi:hypothetical protein